MKKIFNILLISLTLILAVAIGIHCAYAHFNDKLNDVNLVITRNTETGFIDYEDTYELILEICDTVNNKRIKNIPVDSVVGRLVEIPWTVGVEAGINLKRVLDVKIEECQPVARIYNKSGKSVYVDADGNMFPSNNRYVPHLLVTSGIDFPADHLGNVADEEYETTDLPETFVLIKEVLNDEYSKCCVKQIFLDDKKNYIFSMNNTNIIVIFGDVNDIDEKLFNMKTFFDKMQGNPELNNYKEINLNYKNQVVCTKNKNKRR